jgi:excisionase family DNA binding protein
MGSDGIRRAEPVKEFCRSFGVSYDSGRRAIKNGTLKVIRFGNRILVPADEIERVQREGLERGGKQRPESVGDARKPARSNRG